MLWGIGQFSKTVQIWFAIHPDIAPTVAGFLYVTIASLGLGVTINTIRRHTIDGMHHYTGVKKISWDYKTLQKNITAIEFIIANQFRFHQFHGNMFLSVLFSFAAYGIATPHWEWSHWGFFLIIESLLWFGSRDNLQNYYHRLEDILGSKV